MNKIHSVYSHPKGTGLKCPEKSLTQQHFADEVNINKIIERAKITGFIGDPLTPGTRQAMYGDFSNLKTFQDAQNMLIAAQDAFNSLPARIRDRFNNDPQELIDFANDEKNKDEAIKLGIIPDPNEKVVDLATETAATLKDIREALTPPYKNASKKGSKEPKQGELPPESEQ